MSELSSLPNVGKVLEQLLMEAGISTAQQLRELGTKEAFIKIRRVDPGACIQMLYGLEGAVEGVRDTLLPEGTKQELKAFFKTLDG